MLRWVLITLIVLGVFVAMSFGGLLTFDCLRLFDCLQVVFSVVIGLMFVLYGCGFCGLLVIGVVVVIVFVNWFPDYLV